MKDWIKNISSKAISFNKKNIQLCVHILLDKFDDKFTAHCLEFDITTDGDTQEQALQNAIDCIKDHVEFCIAYDNLDKLLDPAPQEFWNKLLCSKPLKSFPFPIDKFTAPINNPIKEVEAYQVFCHA